MTTTRWDKRINISLLGLSLAALVAFQTPKPTFYRLKSGTEYRIYKRENGRYVRRPAVPATGDATYSKRIGQVLALHLEYRTAKDSVLFRSRQQQMGFPVRVPLPGEVRKGTLEEAFALLQAGDSAVFRFNADSLSLKTTGQPVSPQIKKHGKTMTLFVKAVAIQSEADAMAAQQKDMQGMQVKIQQQAEKQKPVDDKLIQAYLQKNHLQAQKTTLGTYYVITQPGAGPKPQAGQTVTVRYTGSLLSGKVFDSTDKHGGTPLDFVLGRGQVIPGWDDGIAQLPKGSKATLLIPSGQGYGSRGAGADIPPNAILRFDVELTDVK